MEDRQCLSPFPPDRLMGEKALTYRPSSLLSGVPWLPRASPLMAGVQRHWGKYAVMRAGVSLLMPSPPRVTDPLMTLIGAWCPPLTPQIRSTGSYIQHYWPEFRDLVSFGPSCQPPWSRSAVGGTLHSHSGFSLQGWSVKWPLTLGSGVPWLEDPSLVTAVWDAWFVAAVTRVILLT
ncbi:hypothetical protein ACOMHN_028773 [Nucella lapillus]